MACVHGFVDIVKELLKDERVNPSDWDNRAIEYALDNGHMDVVNALLNDKRVDRSTLGELEDALEPPQKKVKMDKKDDVFDQETNS